VQSVARHKFPSSTETLVDICHDKLKIFGRLFVTQQIVAKIYFTSRVRIVNRQQEIMAYGRGGAGNYYAAQEESKKAAAVS